MTIRTFTAVLLTIGGLYASAVADPGFLTGNSHTVGGTSLHSFTGPGGWTTGTSDRIGDTTLHSFRGPGGWTSGTSDRIGGTTLHSLRGPGGNSTGTNRPFGASSQFDYTEPDGWTTWPSSLDSPGVIGSNFADRPAGPQPRVSRKRNAGSLQGRRFRTAARSGRLAPVRRMRRGSRQVEQRAAKRTTTPRRGQWPWWPTKRIVGRRQGLDPTSAKFCLAQNYLNNGYHDRAAEILIEIAAQSPPGQRAGNAKAVLKYLREGDARRAAALLESLWRRKNHRNPARRSRGNSATKRDAGEKSVKASLKTNPRAQASDDQP